VTEFEEQRLVEQYYGAIRLVKHYSLGVEVGVAIIDTGISPLFVNEWMAANLPPGIPRDYKMFCAINRPPAYRVGLMDYSDDASNQHGTLVAKILSHLAPLNARFHIIKAIPSDGMAEQIFVEQALERLAPLIKDHNLKVVNFSLNAEVELPWFSSQVAQIRKLGVAFIVSAGNHPNHPAQAGDLQFPAQIGTISVGSHELNPLIIHPKSCGGCKASIFAPGIAILPGGGNVYGTSFAAPIGSAAFVHMVYLYGERRREEFLRQELWNACQGVKCPWNHRNGAVGIGTMGLATVCCCGCPKKRLLPNQFLPNS